MAHSRNGRTPFRHSFIAVAMVAISTPRPVAGLESIELKLAELAGEGWRAPGARATLSPTPDGLALRLFVPSLLLADGPQPPFESVELECSNVAINSQYVSCTEGVVGLRDSSTDGVLQSRLSFIYRREDGAWRASGSVDSPGPSADWSVASGRDGIVVAVHSSRLALSSLSPWLPPVAHGQLALAGDLSDFSARIDLPVSGPAEAVVRLEGSGLGFDTPGGRVAAAGVSVSLESRGREESDGRWRVTGELTMNSGEFLAGPLYARIGEAPVTASASVSTDWESHDVESFDFRDPGALQVRASGRWNGAGADAALRSLRVKELGIEFPGFFERYLQSVLAQHGFGELSVSGSASGLVTWEDGGLRELDLGLDHMDVADDRGRLEVTNLDGRIEWHSQGEPRSSHLTWQSAQLYRLPLGSVDLRADSAGDDFRLARRTVIPVLDGSLVINDFEAKDWFSREASLLFDAGLMPVSLARLSAAFGWPEMAGTLSGGIPALTYDNGVYRLGGLLEVEAFDGTLLVENLRLERPFGVLPKLVADVELHQLDLQQLTGTFSFGEIRGRLGGFIRDLRLLDWQPVHFDAEFHTPADDESVHRISQRAVDTLTSIGGGGASGALSRTFLRVFDDFAYRRIGLSCRLDNNICNMGGVAPAPNGGYYIVEGSGLPRVDVIGHVREVDWPRLIRQLIQATRGNAPVVGEKPN